MPTYTIVNVSDQVREWNSKAGAAFKSYRVTLRNEAGAEKPNVEDSRPAAEPPPKPGDTVEGTVENREQYGPKLNRPRKPGGGSGWKPKPPEERRSIAMQASQKVAVDIVRIAADTGKQTSEVAQQVEFVAGLLFKQVQAAEKQQGEPST